MAKTLRFVRPTSFHGYQYAVGDAVPTDMSKPDVENLRGCGQIEDLDDKAVEKMKAELEGRPYPPPQAAKK